MKPCSTDDTPPRATCKKTFYICINNLIFAEQKLVIAPREKKETCKSINNVTGLTIVTDANTVPPPSLNFIYLKCNADMCLFVFIDGAMESCFTRYLQLVRSYSYYLRRVFEDILMIILW